jgi:hypothetical protein
MPGWQGTSARGDGSAFLDLDEPRRALATDGFDVRPSTKSA